ncbi:bleomycin resistance protein [Enemella evansiae]|uniref:VOC family protein n=1 Tax=Enemella evansiae TaxID=2016499 RepID=UPI000B978E58|nr:VOC family protein [Enemella evansiae]OYN98074.1 bleomycin resistance protein [Enemella evansiae]
MSLDLTALTINAHDPEALAGFWAGVLDRRVLPDEDGIFVLPPVRPVQFRIEFAPSAEPKRGANRMHFDLTSTSPEDQQQTVQRVLELGGRHLDIGQGPEASHVVLADPEGDEFCVIEPGNGFLADTDVIGALSGDGTRSVGYFWSAALDWPLVWDQDSETAIQAPAGGSKLTWGGPPVAEKLGKNRFHLDLAPPVDGDQLTEAERLLSLGARRVDIGQGAVPWVVLADPDGNEFCVLTPR